MNDWYSEPPVIIFWLVSPTLLKILARRSSLVVVTKSKSTTRQKFTGTYVQADARKNTIRARQNIGKSPPARRRAKRHHRIMKIEFE